MFTTHMALLVRQKIPSEVVIEITGQCNMHCTYCTQSGRRTEHLPLRKIERIIDETKKLGVKAIRITGGEPLLVPYLAEVLALCKKSRLYTLLNTNATALTAEQACFIGKTVDNVLVSLQGYDQRSTNKLTRMPNDFAQKLNNIFLLRSYVPILRLGTVITPTLIKHFNSYRHLIEKVRPAVWELFRPMTIPAQKRDPGPRVYAALALPLLRLQKKGIRAVIGNALPFCILKGRKTARRVFAGARADDGHTRLVFDAKGFYKPSYFINKNLGTDLKKAWQHPFMQQLNDTLTLPLECQHCEDLEVCRGGSRVLDTPMDKDTPDDPTKAMRSCH